MKAVKIIVTILVILTVIFFATGLVVKESTYSIEISIDKPLEETFAKFNDISTISEWIPEYKSIEITDNKPGVTGSIYSITVLNNEEEVIIREKILGYVKNEKVTQSFDRDAFEEIDDFTFKSDGLKTIITLNSSYQAKSYILGCVLPYFKGKFKGADQLALDNFKIFVEK